jgi:DNA repair protein RecN (Recombination protein N)
MKLSRFYIKDHFIFKKALLEFENGLVVFTGPSGAGKSVLMDVLLSMFGLRDSDAKIAELTVEASNFDSEYQDNDSDDLVIKQTKKDKTRFFINEQTISKSNLKKFSADLIKHLHIKDKNDFDSEVLLNFIDKKLTRDNSKFEELKSSYTLKYKDFAEITQKLNKLEDDEKNLEELKEFLRYEIEKIAAINPQEGEYDELMDLKKRLSKKEKISEAIEKAEPFFTYVSSVSNALEILDVDSSSFDETINDISATFESFKDSLSELEELDIEATLDRIEKLSHLTKRFGSIKEAIEYKDEKQKELDRYLNITFEKDELAKSKCKLEKEIAKYANELTNFRKDFIEVLTIDINRYVKELYLQPCSFELTIKPLDIHGQDRVTIILNGVSIDSISSGEFNRLRLALLSVWLDYSFESRGILLLDEIDANLSGKESQSIANILRKLSSFYQVFAISHQPQLTSSANQHFLVYKSESRSIVKPLNKDERVSEIARMISGEDISEQAMLFAKELIKN